MSSIPHGYHEREHGRPLLFDGCEACEDHASKRGLSLDGERFREAWQVMIEVEFSDDDHYRSEAEKKLCWSLYETALTMQRFFGLHPRLLVVVI